MSLLCLRIYCRRSCRSHCPAHRWDPGVPILSTPSAWICGFTHPKANKHLQSFSLLPSLGNQISRGNLMLPSLVSHIKLLGVPRGAPLIHLVQSRTRDGLQRMKDELSRQEGDGEEQ